MQITCLDAGKPHDYPNLYVDRNSHFLQYKTVLTHSAVKTLNIGIKLN